jgi:prepilin-type processing-associated H-X9-DG protein
MYARGSYRAVSGKTGNVGQTFWDTCEPNASWDPLNPAWRGLLHSVGFPSRCPAMGNRNSAEKFASMADGSSNTIVVGEYTNIDVPRRRTFWAYSYTSYNSSSITDQSRILGNSYNRCASLPGPGADNPCKRGFGSMHAGGLNYVMGDGSIRFISYGVDINMLAALATIAGGELSLLD